MSAGAGPHGGPVDAGGTARVPALDVLRGVAVLGILVVNVRVFADPGGLYSDRRLTGPDAVVEQVVQVAFVGKFYVLFALLFGYGLALQAERPGARWRIARRLLALLVLGVGHAVLLYPGDILLVYAVSGALVLPLLRVRAGTALRVGAGLLAAVAVLSAAAVVLTALGPDDPVASDLARAAYAEQVLQQYRSGPADVVAQRVWDLRASAPLAAVAVPVVGSLLLLGVAAGRWGLLHRRDPSPRLLRRVCLLGLVLGTPPAVYSAWESGAGGARGLAAAAVGSLTAPALTVAYGAAVLLAVRTARGRRVLTALAPVGRMSLTNYLAQSAVCAMLFTGYGFALAGRIGVPAQLGIAAAVLALQVLLSSWWLRSHRHGPVERLLRSAAYLRIPAR